MRYINLLILFSILLTGCIGRQPTKDEITGTWVSAGSATLEFNRDGTFTGQLLPSEWFIINTDEYIGKKFSGSGTWVISNDRKSWDQLPWIIKLDFKKTNPPDYIGGTQILISGSNFFENKPPWQNLFLWEGKEGEDRYEFNKKIIHP